VARSPLGVAGTLVAHIIATTHNRDIWGQLPKPGERIVLGSGTLFTESYAGAPVIGVNPADGRETDWMNCDAIGRCRDQLVRLAFEVPEAGQPALPAIGPEVKVTGSERRAGGCNQQRGRTTPTAHS
jgi:hypothetical protein